MFIFLYTALILGVGIANKFLQSLSGEYAARDLFTDLPMIILTYFGLIALWGRAKHTRYLSEKFWRVYFLVVMASLIIVPIFDQSIRSLMDVLGVLPAVAAYAVTVILLIPYYWALYSYAYGKKRVWVST